MKPRRLHLLSRTIINHLPQRNWHTTYHEELRVVLSVTGDPTLSLLLLSILRELFYISSVALVFYLAL